MEEVRSAPDTSNSNVMKKLGIQETSGVKTMDKPDQLYLTANDADNRLKYLQNELVIEDEETSMRYTIKPNKDGTYFYSGNYLPINISDEYKKKLKHLPMPPEYACDQVKEAFYSLNFARNNPAIYSDNVLKILKTRFRDDNMYFSYLGYLEPTEEGIDALESAIKYVSS